MSPGGRPRRLLGVLLLLGTLLVSGCGDDDTGPDLVTYEGPGFSIDLPGEPTVTSDTVASPSGDLDVTFYAVQSDELNVSVAVTMVPKGVPADLDGAVEGGAANIGATVESSVPFSSDGHRGRDARFTGTKDGSDFTAFCRILADGRRLYQVIQFFKGDLTTAPDLYTEIVGSLTLE